MKPVLISGAAIASLLIAVPAPVTFESKPRVVSAGAYPQIAVRASGALSLLKVEKGDLWYVTSFDGGDSFESRVRVNDTPGEIAAHAENSPQLFLRSRSELYTLWQARRSGADDASVLRFARSTNWGESFSKPIDVDSSTKPATQGFYTMQVSPNGVIYAAWLDARDRGKGRSGTSAVYLARSTDHGVSFEKSVRVALDACPCCRPAIAVADENTIHVSLRAVFDNDVRDTVIATSADGGKTWAKPVRVAEDDWRINGCPHSGASLAVLGKRLYVAWHTVRERQSAVYLAWSDDAGKSFSRRLPLADGVLDANHPYLQAGAGKVGIVFQGRAAQTDGGWGKVNAYYREVSADGHLSPLAVIGHAAGSASYPTLVYEQPDHVFVAWTEAGEETQKIVLARGRETAAVVSRSNDHAR
jgi:BNR repeat protein